MQIEPLTKHTSWIPEIARWFYAEWKPLYGNKTIHEVENSIRERLNEDRIPCALVAIEGQAVVGTISLKESDMDIRKELSPWMAGLYVVSSRRGRGIGAQLAMALEQKARELGVCHLYLYTPRSEIFYGYMGWSIREKIIYMGSEVSVMEKELNHP